MVELISNSEEETKILAEKVAKKLKKGNVVILTGDLGSGKTKFTEGILTYFNLQDEISSPTFTIVNEYSKQDISIYHFDVYRLEDADEFLAIGGEEYFEKGICIIEWGETIEEVLPKDAIRIKFFKSENDESYRKITIENLKIEN